MSWPKYPLICEINAWTWLNDLPAKGKKKNDLSSVPESEFERLALKGYDAIWLMGVWERSPAGIRLARENEGILKDLRSALPDFEETDLAGSPYCIRNYQVDQRLGGKKGLAAFRKNLARHGMKLILDFVPNHVAPDHPWTETNPEYFVLCSEKESRENPGTCVQVGKSFFALARDPFYPPWPDVLQLNVFNQGLISAFGKTLKDIALQCDGIRCDMAMLVTNNIFSNTWKDRVGLQPALGFWEQLIPVTKKVNPEFLFIAEAYWDTEWEMMQQGFDFCYDKRLYDRLLGGDPESVRLHLGADLDFQSKLFRFLENHDEPRAANIHPLERHMALAVSALTLPGARMIHQGQPVGKTTKVPVFLGRNPAEEGNPNLRRFYDKLLELLRYETLRSGNWNMCEVIGWPENTTFRNLLAWEWHDSNESILVVVNLSAEPAQGRVRSRHTYDMDKNYQLYDVISMELYYRDGDQLNDPGLFIGLPGWGVHTFSIEH